MIYNWSAKRSGAHMTVTGERADGTPVRLTGIFTVEVDREGLFAVGEWRERHRLAPTLCAVPA